MNRTRRVLGGVDTALDVGLELVSLVWFAWVPAFERRRELELVASCNDPTLCPSRVLA